MKDFNSWRSISKQSNLGPRLDHLEKNTELHGFKDTQYP